jgi:hypothetical protein
MPANLKSQELQLTVVHRCRNTTTRLATVEAHIFLQASSSYTASSYGNGSVGVGSLAFEEENFAADRGCSGFFDCDGWCKSHESEESRGNGELHIDLGMGGWN